LELTQGAIDPDQQEDLYKRISEMIQDFRNRWGERITHHSTVERGGRNCQVGIPTYAFWAVLLDPRTQNRLSKILNSEAESRWVGCDVKMTVLEVMRSTAATVNNNNIENLQDGSQ
jgi:hypothetical protein